VTGPMGGKKPESAYQQNNESESAQSHGVST
jgi:hypothetical protein